MTKRDSAQEKNFTWPLSKKLLFSILNDQVSDVFVCELIWDRLFYTKEISSKNWISSKHTPPYWAEKYNNAPQIISERSASIQFNIELCCGVLSQKIVMSTLASCR